MQKRDWPVWAVYALAALFVLCLIAETTLLVRQAHDVLDVTGRQATAIVTLNIEGEPLANLTLTKTASPDPANISTPVNYTIIINSTGSATAYNITLNETYPTNVTFLTSSPTPVTGTNTTFIIPNLTSGTIYRVNITLNITNDTTNGTSLLNLINVTFTNTTAGLESRTATATVTAIIPPNETEETTPETPSGGGSGGGGGCTDACIYNTTMCSTIGRLRCLRYYDADLCTEYAPDPCVTGTRCSLGECVTSCIEEWDCTDWSSCSEGLETRSCTELNGCATDAGTPTMSRACVPGVEEIPDRLLGLIDRKYLSLAPVPLPLELIIKLPVLPTALFAAAALALFGILFFLFGNQIEILILYLRIYHCAYLLHTKQYALAHAFIENTLQSYFKAVRLDPRNRFHRKLARDYYGLHRDLARHYASLAHAASDTAKHAFWNERAEHYAREALKYQ